MRALVFDSKLVFDGARKPPVPAPGECLVKVHLVGICSTDVQITRGYMGFTGILGHEMVGTVEEGSPTWRGRRVAGEINCVCRTCDMCQAGLANHCRRRTVMGIAGRDGCFADFVALPEHNLHEVPAVISDEQAVFIEPLAAAWQVVKQVPIDPRMKVAVVGSGKLGLLVAQVINTFECQLEVIGRNPRTLLLCEKKRIRSRHVDRMVPQGDCDVVVECTGAPEGMAIALSLVRPRGTIVLKSTFANKSQLDLAPAMIDLAPAVVNEINIVGSRCGPFPEAISSLRRELIDVRSMISKVLPLERGVEAMDAATDPGNVKVLLKINPR